MYNSESPNVLSNVLKILYYNARSLLAKFDELLILADSHNPDIQDSEILIPGYQSLRHDRNRHGGGVLMYVSHRFTVKLLPFHPSLELLTVTLHSGNFKFCLSLFYRPPSSSVEVLYIFLRKYLQSVNISQFSSFVLIGDFNINFSDSSHPSFSNLCNNTEQPQPLAQPYGTDYSPRRTVTIVKHTP